MALDTKLRNRPFPQWQVGAMEGVGAERGSRFSQIDLHVHGSVWDAVLLGCLLIHTPADPRTPHYVFHICLT